MTEGNVQCSRNPLRLHLPLLHGSQNHFVFLNRCHSADTRVIGVTLVIICNDAVRFRFPKLSECMKTEMSVNQQILSRCALLRMHHQWFNQPNFRNGPHNRLIPVNPFLAADLPHRQYIFQRQADFLHVKAKLQFTHAASLYFLPNLVCRYFGIVDNDSARNKVTKFSSAKSFPNAVTIKTSLASQILAFFYYLPLSLT